MKSVVIFCIFAAKSTEMSSKITKDDLTWHDILVRAVLVIASVAIIVWLMPRRNSFNYNIEKGKPWIYSDLSAPFDFPVYKSDSIVKHEREQVMRDFLPYYIYSASTTRRWRAMRYDSSSRTTTTESQD